MAKHKAWDSIKHAAAAYSMQQHKAYSSSIKNATAQRMQQQHN